MKKLITASLLALILLTSTTQAADEGIKVHGHWTFKIYNPDGSFDRKVEFENNLLFSGRNFLLKVLNRENSVGKWQIALNDSTTPALCGTDDNNLALQCYIVESGENSSGSIDTFDNLTHSISSNKLVLNGSFTVFGGSFATSVGISKVETRLYSCTVDSTNCASTALNQIRFTQRDLGSNLVSVSNGQIVQVTVEISFS